MNFTATIRRQTPDARRQTPDASYIHVVLSVYDPSGKYSQHAGVTITSVFEHTESKVIVHILHDDTLTEDNRRKFMRTAEKYSQAIDFIDVSEYQKRIGQDIMDLLEKKYTIGALYRLTIQNVIHEDKVIYLDCDIIVNLDIKELWEIDPDNNYIAAVFDNGIVHSRRFSNYYFNCKVLGCNPREYINSGVIIMNLKLIRESFDFFTLSTQWLKRHQHAVPFADQDILNVLFKGSIKFIDKKFNRQSWDEDEDLSGNIIHMILCKPWNVPAHTKINALFWDTYLKSAWGENINTVEDAIILVNRVLEKSIYFHRSPNLCINRIKNAAFNIHTVHYPYFLNVIKYYVLDCFYWFKYKFSR